MIEKFYKCEFKSDIVLPASSNTQGNITLLEFIPGSNFLGMVAVSYKDLKEKSFNIFHSGDVRFSDAHIMVNSQMSYKMPLSFHNLKVGDEEFNRLHLTKEEEQNLRILQKQLKQRRSGFINENFQVAHIAYSYSQKSAYSTQLRRSKDEHMFGYSALKKGTTWLFKVSYVDESYIPLVEAQLLGEKRLGKSKTAQYGQVLITQVEVPQKITTFTPEDNLTYLYINSRIALLDEEGNPTLTPTIKNLGLNSGSIDWEKTYIKTSSYAPFNYKRQTKEYERLCINKGSVITIKNIDDNEIIPHWIGAYLSEGFGEIIINPSFLSEKTPKLSEVEKEDSSASDITNYDKNLILFLENKLQEENKKFEIATSVQVVYEKFIGPSKSQWGEIRSIASQAKSKDELIAKIKEFVSHGVSKKMWDKIENKLIVEIEKSSYPLEFTKLLAMIVSKHTKNKKEEK
jgi:hypothetical protein